MTRIRPWTDAQILHALRNGSGRGVRIGLLDTGVESQHAGLCGKISGNYEISMKGGHGHVYRVPEATDPAEHGTACAHILSRLAPAAEIHSVRVISECSGDSPRKLAAGLRFALDQEWDIINVSAGAARHHPALHALAARAWKERRIIVAAKDNRPGEIGYPASYKEVLAVDMAHFEDPLELCYRPVSPVELEAKGIYVRAACATGGERFYTGSSFAAPHVSAIAARLREHIPCLDARLLREALKTISRPADTGGAG